MKHTVRAFAVGLVTAGIILLGVFYFFDEPNENIEDITTEKLITHIEEEGLRVISEEEYISYSLDNESGNDDVEVKKEETEETEEEIENIDEDKDDTNEKEEEEEEEDSPSTVTITIERGMASSHISDMLEDEGLIDDAGDFNDYLLDNDYSLYVRMGDHELETGMSHYEIAEALTN